MSQLLGRTKQKGVYAPLIFDPDDRSLSRTTGNVVVLSVWTFKSVEGMIGDLKKQGGLL